MITKELITLLAYLNHSKLGKILHYMLILEKHYILDLSAKNYVIVKSNVFHCETFLTYLNNTFHRLTYT